MLEKVDPTRFLLPPINDHKLRAQPRQLATGNLQSG